MFRKFIITSLVAFGLVATPIATPAAFAKDDGDRLLIALTALGVLGVIAHESSKTNTRPVYVQPRQYYNGRGQVVRPPQHAYVPPRHCLRQKWTRNGWVQFYNQPCVNKSRPVARNGYYRR